MASTRNDDAQNEDPTNKIEPLDPPLPSPSSSHEAEELEDDHDQHDTEKGHASPDKPDAQRPELSRVVSKPFSLRKVPLSRRNGWLGRLSLLYEAEEPKGYPRSIKWFITFEIALAAIAAPMGSAIILRMLFSEPRCLPLTDTMTAKPH